MENFWNISFWIVLAWAFSELLWNFLTVRNHKKEDHSRRVPFCFFLLNNIKPSKTSKIKYMRNALINITVVYIIVFFYQWVQHISMSQFKWRETGSRAETKFHGNWLEMVTTTTTTVYIPQTETKCISNFHGKKGVPIPAPSPSPPSITGGKGLKSLCLCLLLFFCLLFLTWHTILHLTHCLSYRYLLSVYIYPLVQSLHCIGPRTGSAKSTVR
jgi:hypothetical protein